MHRQPASRTLQAPSFPPALLWLLLPFLKMVTPFSMSKRAHMKNAMWKWSINGRTRGLALELHKRTRGHPALLHPPRPQVFALRATAPSYCQSNMVTRSSASLFSTHRDFTLKSTKSPADNYYQSASSLAQFSSTSATDDSFPKWWPREANVTPHQKYIALADHIAHVIVPPNATTTDSSGTENLTLNCEDVIYWVLNAAMTGDDSVELRKASPSSDTRHRWLRIQDEWREGESVSNSTHVLDPAYRHDPSLLPQHNNNQNIPDLLPIELLALGSVWHLPLSAAPPTIDRFDPSNGIKPRRLTVGDCNITINPGDYLRIHFDPRRFCESNAWDWGCSINETKNDKHGVIVSRNDDVGYLIIDKPSNVPVHARVDNVLENVASSIGRMLWMERRDGLVLDSSISESSDVTANLENTKSNKRKQKIDQLVYVASPQRLDQNTSGLLVVATKKSFAAYFAKLLRTKTNGQLNMWRNESLTDKVQSKCGIHKTYKCLLCIMRSTRSMREEVEMLQSHALDGTVIRHFLEPSIKAPKAFYSDVPHGVENPESWAECLLRITSVDNVCTVVGNQPSRELAKALWGEYGKPPACIGVAELEVELLTGRTHQIRGQFAALGMPLVGDAQYGGAIPSTSALLTLKIEDKPIPFLDFELLALQCSALEFLNPLVDNDNIGLHPDKLQRSDQWITFRLNHAFWTPALNRYESETSKLSLLETTSSLDEEVILMRHSNEKPIQPEANALPSRVVLSKGANKYVIIRATNNSLYDDELYFVRSASPEECGGPYHVNVAQELLSVLQSLGFAASVIGGGRINYIETDNISHAHVYGFSYGFGKGDHELVSSIIEAHTAIVATFDNRDEIY